MKTLLLTVYAAVFLGCFFGKAQVIRNASGLTPTNPILTNPSNITQFEVSGKLITQNAFIGTTAIPTAQQTGNFGSTARWNSMGGINAGTQLLNGFRTQTNGRALTLGYSVAGVTGPNPTGTSVSNPVIQWIGNTAGVLGGVNTPGSLEFKYAANPGTPGNPQVDVPIFTMKPATTVAPFLPSFNYAETNALIGQLQSGAFGSFGAGDTWSATGQIVTPNVTSYGARQQYQGYTLTTSLLKTNVNNDIVGVMDFGKNLPATGDIPGIFKFRVFTDALNVNAIKNVWQSNTEFGNMILGRGGVLSNGSAKFYLSLFDGAATQASNTVLSVVERAGIYSTTDTNAPDGGFVDNYAAVVGDISAYENAAVNQNSFRAGILGIGRNTNLTSTPNNWSGYFIGDVGITGTTFNTSDAKFKKDIKAEIGSLEKMMQLQPKTYFFDATKNDNMGLNKSLQHGLISQEVALIFPELVKDITGPGNTIKNGEKPTPTSYKGLNYLGLISVMVSAIQELNQKITTLETQLKATNTLVINENLNLPQEIENKAFSLSQNAPNPFSEKTTISYSIPNIVSKASLVVFDMTGKLLQQYTLLQGKNQLTISGNTLQAGMYMYSLLADGQEVVSKRMVLTK